MWTAALILSLSVGCADPRPPQTPAVTPQPGIPEASQPIAEAPRPLAAPTGSIQEALGAVPGSVSARYSLSLSADRTRLTIDPAAALRTPIARSAGGVIAEDSANGGKVLQLGAGPFDRAAWQLGTLGARVTDEAGRERLAQAGYALDIERHLLVVTAEGDPDPTVFAFSSDAQRGVVAVCSEVSVFDFSKSTPTMVARKPVIYLYPEQPMQVRVDVALQGDFLVRYPVPERDGWNVWAEPDGLLKDPSGRQHRYLFWEGAGASFAIDPDEAYCVPGSETAAFLERVCEANALTDVECGDFVTYWLPTMGGNPYNLIAFPDAAYERYAQLTVEPEPDTVIRQFMVFQGRDRPVRVGSPALPKRERRGFTVVEWGGVELDRR